MIKISRAVIVEGKYDKIRLSSVLDALIIETGGFKIFSDREKREFIKRLAETKGIVILTDGDGAGFKIRALINSLVDTDKVINLYIPDIYGREKRKTENSKEGKLGVEGMPEEILIKLFESVGIACETASMPRKTIENRDLYADGLTGGPDSAEKRKRLLKHLGLPERMPKNLLMKTLNAFFDYEEYKAAVSCF